MIYLNLDLLLKKTNVFPLFRRRKELSDQNKLLMEVALSCTESSFVNVFLNKILLDDFYMA